MNKRTLHCLISLLAALVMAVSLLTGCGTKTAEQVQQQEDAQTIQVYLDECPVRDLCPLCPVPAAGREH